MLAMAAGVQYIALLCRGVDPVFCIVQLSPTNICKHLSWECSVNLSTAKWRIDFFQKTNGLVHHIQSRIQLAYISLIFFWIKTMITYVIYQLCKV